MPRPVAGHRIAARRAAAPRQRPDPGQRRGCANAAPRTRPAARPPCGVGQHRDRLHPPQLLRLGVAERPQRVGQERDRGVQPGDHPDRGPHVEPRRPRLGRPGPLRELLRHPLSLPLRRQRRVRSHHLPVQPSLEPTPRQRPVHERHHRRIHEPRRPHRQVPRLRRDQPGEPDPRLTRPQPLPDQRQPVPHVQRIRHEPPRRPGPHPHPRTQLRIRELRHPRRPHPTETHRRSVPGSATWRRLWDAGSPWPGCRSAKCAASSNNRASISTRCPCSSSTSSNVATTPSSTAPFPVTCMGKRYPRPPTETWRASTGRGPPACPSTLTA